MARPGKSLETMTRISRRTVLRSIGAGGAVLGQVDADAIPALGATDIAFDGLPVSGSVRHPEPATEGISNVLIVTIAVDDDPAWRIWDSTVLYDPFISVEVEGGSIERVLPGNFPVGSDVERSGRATGNGMDAPWEGGTESIFGVAIVPSRGTVTVTVTMYGRSDPEEAIEDGSHEVSINTVSLPEEGEPIAREELARAAENRAEIAEGFNSVLVEQDRFSDRAQQAFGEALLDITIDGGLLLLRSAIPAGVEAAINEPAAYTLKVLDEGYKSVYQPATRDEDEEEYYSTPFIGEMLRGADDLLDAVRNLSRPSERYARRAEAVSIAMTSALAEVAAEEAAAWTEGRDEDVRPLLEEQLFFMTEDYSDLDLSEVDQWDLNDRIDEHASDVVCELYRRLCVVDDHTDHVQRGGLPSHLNTYSAIRGRDSQYGPEFGHAVDSMAEFLEAEAVRIEDLLAYYDATVAEEVPEERVAFEIERVDANDPVEVGDELRVTVVVENEGDEADTQELGLEGGEDGPVSEELSLESGESETVEFVYEPTEADAGDLVLVAFTEDDEEAIEVEIETDDLLERVTPDRERLTVEPGTRLFFEAGPGDLDELPDREAIEWSSDADPLWTQVQSYRDFYPENDFEILEFGSTGTYDVEVEVTDEDGRETSIDWTVDVEPGGIEPPDTEQVRPDEHLLADPGETVDLELTVSDPDGALERVLWHYLHIASTPGIVDIDDIAAVEGDQATTSAAFEIRDGNAWAMRGWVLDENGALAASESWRARSEFEVTITGTNDPIEPGDTLEVDVAVENASELRDLQEVGLEVAREDIDGEWVDLESGEGESVTLRYDTSEDDVGDLEVTVRSIHDEDATQVTVGTDERDHELTVQPGTTVLFEAPLPDGVDSNDVEWFVDGESEGEIFFFGYWEYAENAVFSPAFETAGEYDVEARYPGGTDSVRWLVTVTETGAGPPEIEELSHDPSEGETIGVYDPIEITTTAHDPEDVLDRVVWQEGRNQVGIYTDDISGERDTGTLEFDEPPLWIGAGYPTMAAVVSDDGRVSEIERQVGPEVRPPLEVEIVETNSPVTAGDTAEVTVAVENTGHIQLVGPTRQPIELDVGEGTGVDSSEVDVGYAETETVTLTYETNEGDVGDLEMTARSPDHEATTTVTVEEARERDVEFHSCTEVEIIGEYDDVYLHASYLSGPTDAGVYVLEAEPFPVAGDAVIDVSDHEDTDAQLYVDSVSLSVDGEITPASPAEDVDDTVENPLEKSLEGCEEARTGERPDASITLSDQSSDGESVTVDAVDLSHGGFVAVYDASDDGYHPTEDPGMPMEFQSTHVVGSSAYLEAGTYESLEVDLEEPLEDEQRLVAIPHRDSTESETFEFVESGGYVDWPYHSSPPYDDALVELEGEPIEELDVTILETNDPVSAGGTLEVVAQVENAGDEPVTEEVDLLIGDDREHADSATVDVGPGATETATLVYETFPVDQDVEFSVSVVVGESEAERTVDVHADGPPDEPGDLEVTIISAVDPVQGGEWFEVTVEVTNTGEGEVTQDVQFLVGESRELEDSQTVTVGPGETRTITLGYETYPVDQDVQFPVAVVTEDDEVTHTVDVLGTGSGPGEGTGALSVTITGTNAPVDAGTFLEVTTLVENTGDGEATQEIRLLVGGDQVDSHSVTVGPGASQTVSLGYETYPVQQDVEVTVSVQSDDDTDSRTVTVFGQ